MHNQAIVESMREFSHVSYTYERAVIPTGVILAILADLSQPLLTLRLISAVFIDLTAYRNLRIARNNIADVLARPREEGSFDAVPMRGRRSTCPTWTSSTGGDRASCPTSTCTCRRGG